MVVAFTSRKRIRLPKEPLEALDPSGLTFIPNVAQKNLEIRAMKDIIPSLLPNHACSQISGLCGMSISQ